MKSLDRNTQLALFIAFAMVALTYFGLLSPESAALGGAMFGVTYTETNRIGDVLKLEYGSLYNREHQIVLSGQNLLCGAVVGQQLVGATGTAAAVAGNVGNGTMGAVTVGTGAKRGRHTIVITEPGTNVGEFTHFDPDGIPVGQGTVAAAYSAGGLGFTLADGATDFAVGDAFTIDVTGGTYKSKAWDPTATDGAQNLAGILLYDTNATSADTIGQHLVRGPAVVARDALVWGGGVTAAQKLEAERLLNKLGIVCRDAV